jgi:hypothetical protein
MAEKVKIKTKYGTISATPEQAKNWKAREEGDRVKKERISAVKENARSLNRYRQQAQTYKQQTKARERRAAGGYDATPTNMYGQPIESFWQSAPIMPEMKPVPQTSEVPNFPIDASYRSPNPLINSMLYPKTNNYGTMDAWLGSPSYKPLDSLRDYYNDTKYITQDPIDDPMVVAERKKMFMQQPYDKNIEESIGVPMGYGGYLPEFAGRFGASLYTIPAGLRALTRNPYLNYY